VALTSKQRRYLRAAAHALAPVVHIGQRGITTPLTAQVDRGLTDHELIKVKLTKECPLTVAAAGEALAGAVGCDVAGAVGRVLILFRARAEYSAIRLPDVAGGREN
jgi:RNA-binding protein